MDFRSRIREYKRVKAADLVAHPDNTRGPDDPDQVRHTADSLERLGQVAPLVVRPLDDNGRWQIVDGHLRANIAQDAEVDVAVTDLSEDEAGTVILALNRIAAMRVSDDEKLLALLQKQEGLTGTGYEQDDLLTLLAGQEDPVGDPPQRPVGSTVWGRRAITEGADVRMECGEVEVMIPWGSYIKLRDGLSARFDDGTSFCESMEAMIDAWA